MVDQEEWMDDRGSTLGAEDVATLSRATLSAVSNRFDEVARDRGVRAAFGYLVSLSSRAAASDGLAGRD